MPKKECLIVDDSDVIRRITRHMLGSMPFTTFEAVNGHDALSRCAKSMPDVILLDWLMPELAGLACLQSLRKLPGGGRPRVIYCLSANDPLEINRAMQAGADDTIIKPFDRETLRQKLETLEQM